jgi:hypothetical protein
MVVKALAKALLSSVVDVLLSFACVGAVPLLLFWILNLTFPQYRRQFHGIASSLLRSFELVITRV